MTVFHIDRSKHPHPRRYKRALGLALLGVVVGLAMTVFGLYLTGLGFTGNEVWLVTPVLLGPSLVFLSAVGFATYMEKLETASYGGSYHDDPPDESPGLAHH